MSDLFYVQYTGIFGFMKPWTAVRDGTTYSQQFLTPSTVEGIRRRLGVSAILRHRLSYDGMSVQQEMVQAAAVHQPRNGSPTRPRGVVKRGTLLRPLLTLVFPSAEDMDIAMQQHLCLSRKQDVLFPKAWGPVTDTELDEIAGFELIPSSKSSPEAFLVGFNRYENGAPMYGTLKVFGDPTRVELLER